MGITRLSEISDSPVIASSSLTEHLKLAFGAHDVLLTGRGAAAIFVALKVACKPGSRVAMPSFVCPSIPTSVIAAGFLPTYLDIKIKDFNIDPNEIDILPDNISALIAPHLFGHPLEIEKIRGKCTGRNIFLIEDIAQSTGIRFGDKPSGCFGDVAIMSFHPSKMTNGVGGGALIVNPSASHLLDELKAITSQLPPAHDNFSLRSKAISARVNSLLETARDGLGGEKEIRRIYLENLDLIPQQNRPVDDTKNLSAFVSLENDLLKRRARSLKYRDLISHSRVIHPKLEFGTPVFRHTILIDGSDGSSLRKSITNRLRTEGIHASNLYYPAHLIFPDSSGHELLNTEWVSNRIINLWLDDCATDSFIQKTADIINSI